MERAASVDPGIFKAYDVRGLYPDQIDGDVAEQLGRAFIRVLAGLAGKPAAELRVGLGRDMRASAPELSARVRRRDCREMAGACSAGFPCASAGERGLETAGARGGAGMGSQNIRFRG